MYGSGNTLSFIRSNGSHIKSLQSHGSGVGAIAVCQNTALVAYAETTLKPEIFTVSYPLCGVKCTIKGKFGFVACNGDKGSSSCYK